MDVQRGVLDSTHRINRNAQAAIHSELFKIAVKSRYIIVADGVGTSYATFAARYLTLMVAFRMSCLIVNKSLRRSICEVFVTLLKSK